MSRWNDLEKLRMEMDKIQAQVKHLHKRGCASNVIADKLEVPEKSVRVIIRWCC